jgi:hypothetical protein
MDDPKIITSPLSGPFSEGGVTVDVQIYRLETKPEWSLEVIDSEGTSIVWDELFDTAEAAHAEFRRCVEEEGLTGIVTDSEPTRH